MQMCIFSHTCVQNTIRLIKHLPTPYARAYRGSIWEVATQLSHFLAVATSLPDRLGVFQFFRQNGVFRSANCIFTAV